MPPEKEYFKNKKTWKQISTNVPPSMLQALRKHVTKERTMSHVLREIILESDVCKIGAMPSPSWSQDLAYELTELRREIGELRADVRAATETGAPIPYPSSCAPDIDFEYSSENTLLDQSAKTLSYQPVPPSLPADNNEEAQELQNFSVEEERPRPFAFLSKFTAILGVRKTA